ncbi:MAG: FAD:protein FMN transferase, partial [Sulfurovaceae bacterium]|nr:FAD:protein FMN transferase [Sulfurovaceae bacterium]
LEKKYNYYDKNSYLSLINTRQEYHLDRESKSLLQRAKQYYTLTNGIFDITIATLKPLFLSETLLSKLAEKKTKLLPFVGCEHFEIKRDKIIFDNDYTQIDLGGFVKEYAVDRAVQIMKKKKIKSALINFGGDIYAIGKNPNGKRFKIGIKDPHNRERHIEYVEIENQALTTSASYERNYTIEKEKFSHIISKEEHPQMPHSVTVISPTCVESGVYSTALMIKTTLKHRNRTIIY